MSKVSGLQRIADSSLHPAIAFVCGGTAPAKPHTYSAYGFFCQFLVAGERARQLLLQVKRWVGERAVIVVGDSSYAVIDLLGNLQGQVSLISRLRLDAALYEPVPVRPAGQRGRKRLKGNRLPTLLAMAADKQTRWESLTVSEWYGGASQTLAYCTGTAVWYHTGKKPVAIRWVLVRLEGKLTGLVSNDTQLEA